MHTQTCCKNDTVTGECASVTEDCGLDGKEYLFIYIFLDFQH
jgi:hypothetical protein